MIGLGSAPTTGLMVIDFVAHTAAQTIELYGFDFFSSKSLSGRRDSKQVPHELRLGACIRLWVGQRGSTGKTCSNGWIELAEQLPLSSMPGLV